MQGTSRPISPLAGASALSRLCQACGMCCNGSLFTFLPLSEDEARCMRDLGGAVQRRKDGRWALQLGCAVLQGTRCGAYGVRPRRCRDFVCQLGRAVERGERSLDAAQAIVEEAKQRLGRLSAMIPEDSKTSGGLGPVQRGLRFEAAEPDDAHFRAVRAVTRETEAFLDHYFLRGA